MGYCLFYDEIESVDIGLVKEILVKLQDCGIVILFNILLGVFIQFVVDNNDFNEENIDGKSMIYDMIFVMYWKELFGLMLLLKVYVNYVRKERYFIKINVYDEILECLVYGK